MPRKSPFTVMLEKHARLAQGLLDEGFSKGSAESYASQMMGGFKTQKQKPRSRLEPRIDQKNPTNPAELQALLR